MASAVVALTRGYSEKGKYNPLIERTRSIIKHVKGSYDVVLFHEGNISEQHQDYIKRSSYDAIKFIDISHVWAGGYEGMCRFMIYNLWQLCKEYEYIMRVDEDCILKSDISPFETEYDYLTSVWWGESHSETNATLPAYLQIITGADPKEFYNNRFPYTNVSAARVEFMLGLRELELIANNPMQKINRWGDLPVIGSLLNIHGTKVGTLSGLTYHHASHNVNIVCK